MEEENDEKPSVLFRRGGKYRNSAKALLPYRRKQATGHPVDNAGFFSTVFFSWLTGIVWKLYRKPVAVEELWKVPKYDAAEPNSDRFLRLWKEELKIKGNMASVKRVIFKFIGTRLIISVLCIFAFILCQFVSNGVVVRYLLKYVENADSDLKYGLALVGGMFAAEVTRMICFSLSLGIGMRTGVRLRSAVTMTVFKKILRVPPNESSSIGEIVNLCSSDGDRLFEATYIGSLLFTGPVMFIAGTAYLCVLVGPIALAGCGLFLVILFFQVLLMKLLNILREKAVAYTDKRVKAINEMLNSIKLIKMYAWEDSFTKVIHGIRNKERNCLHNALVLQGLNIGLASLSPYAAVVLTLTCSVLLGNNLTSSQAFACFSMFHVMSFTLKVIPVALKQAAEAGVAADRVQKILERKEYSEYLQTDTTTQNTAIEITKATLSWPTETSIHEENNMTNGDTNLHKENNETLELAKNVDEKEEPTTSCLTNITLDFAKGSLVGICGRVGSGKSSLVSCLLGHLELNDGSVAVRGTTAYCAQQAWIMNATIQDNITFGLPYDKEKYDRIVKACCLLPDFDILQSGDLTEVGERGVNMSGGQKQRINIARAIYMDKDIYLLDDPLSAVDAHVGKALFENAILTLLKKAGKTVILVTHRLEYLPYCDKVVLMKDGEIWEQGSHDDLMDSGEQYYQLYKMWSKESENELNENTSDNNKHENEKLKISEDIEFDDEAKLERGRLMTNEEKAQGAISAEAYFMYIKYAGGWFVCFLCLLTFLLAICCQQFTSVWLSYWLKQGSGLTNLTDTNSSGMFFTTIMPATANTNFTSGLNKRSVGGFLNTSAETVQTTPTAILSPSSEIAVTDFNTTSAGVLSTTSGETMSNTSAAILSPYNENRIIDNPNLYFYLSIFGYAIAASVVSMVLKVYVFITLCLRASHGLHNKLFDKIIHGTMEFFDTTPTGRILNRFQKDQDMLDTVIPLLLDLVLLFSFIILTCVCFVAYVFPYFLAVLVVILPLFLVAFYLFKGAVREMRRQDNITRSPWLSHITTTITGIQTIRAYKRTKNFVARFCELLDINSVPFYLYSAVNRWLVTRLDFMTVSIVTVSAFLVVMTNGAIPPAFAGLAVSSALMLSLLFQFTVRTSVEVEANFVCAERIVHYITTVPQENNHIMKKDLSARWPEFGSVRFNNVQMRYRDGLPLVLQNISFTINTCEKVGVVGRTGSGKSSLGVAIFRLVELVDGSIEIDGINIANLSLQQLRSKIAIIPQEPMLFTGTVKYNVDPFNQYSEEKIWQALERTHLKETISALPQKLEAPVSENGGNFSVGERQLMCLTRALLRHNKILILDEATASIDARTDLLVQSTLKEHFANCTLITIAHRLNTVTTCDRIMVLDQGKIAEFDTPDNLSKNPDSLLSKLLASTM